MKHTLVWYQHVTVAHNLEVRSSPLNPSQTQTHILHVPESQWTQSFAGVLTPVQYIYKPSLDAFYRRVRKLCANKLCLLNQAKLHLCVLIG